MQVGCCIRRALTSLGTVTAVALIAATGVAGDETVRSTDAAPGITKSVTGNNTVVSQDEIQKAIQAEKERLTRADRFIPSTKVDMTIAPQQAAAPVNNSRGALPGESCDAAIAVMTDGTPIAGDTSTSSYITDETINTELPGTSCGGFDYNLAFSGASTALWYTFVGDGDDHLISLCSTATYDTRMFVFCGDCTTGLFCADGDDDGCTAENSADGLQSELTIGTNNGETYYVLVAGFGTAESGAFDLVVQDLDTQNETAALCMEIPPFMCDMGSIEETEICVTADVDASNDGCEVAADIVSGIPSGSLMDLQNQPISVGDTICGQLPSYTSATFGATFDVDYYSFNVPTEGQYTFTVDSDFSITSIVLVTDGSTSSLTFPADGCANPDVEVLTPIIAGESTSSVAGVTYTRTVCLTPGDYVFRLGGNPAATDEACVDTMDGDAARYQFSITTSGPCPTGACCLADATISACETLSEQACLDAGGTFFGDFADCSALALADLTGAGGLVPACIGFCCLADGTLDATSSSDGGSADDCAALVAGIMATGFQGYNLTPAEQAEVVCIPIPENFTCASALDIVIGGSVTGDTTASPYIVDDALQPELPGTLCGTGYGNAPGVWYTFMGNGNDINLATCGSVDSFDSEIYVFCGDCSGLFCVGGADDGCPAPGNGASNVTVGTEMGNTYFVLVGGFSPTSFGTFTLTATDTGFASVDPVACEICPVVCDMGTPESLDGDCSNPGVSDVEGNDGCDGDGVTGIATNTEFVFVDGSTTVELCGRIGARTVDGTTTSDNDWYVLSNSTSAAVNLSITVASGAAADFTIFNYVEGWNPVQDGLQTDVDGTLLDNGANCDAIDGLLTGISTVGNCIDPVTIEVCLPVGDWFFNILGDTTSNSCMNDEYTITIAPIGDGSCTTGACCLGDGTCSDGLILSECVTLGGTYTDSETCLNNMTTPGSITCLGACCILADMPGMMNTCEDRPFVSEVDEMGMVIVQGCTDDPNFTVWGGVESSCSDMDFMCSTRPVNDECDGAISAPTDGTPAMGSSVNGTADGEVWYTFVGTGNSVTISLCDSMANADETAPFDLQVGLFCADCVEERLLDASDDLGTCMNGFLPELTVCTELGATYNIGVALADIVLGDVALTITDDGMPCTDAPDCSPFGACCLDAMTNECEIITENDCVAQGGTFAGADTECGGPGYSVAVMQAPFTSISTTGTQLTTFTDTGTFGELDEGVATVQIPFAFNYFGSPVAAMTDLDISTNGFASFDDLLSFGVNFFTNQAIPAVTNPNGVLAPQWDDYIIDGTGNGIWIQDNGTSFVVEWNASFFGTPANVLFQLVINDDDTIQFHYADTSSGFASPSFGIEDFTGTFGATPFDDNPDGIALGDLVTFTPNNVPFTCPIMGGDPMGACCIEGACSITTEADCLAMMGSYAGDDTACGSGMGEISCNGCVADFDNNGQVDLTDFGVFGAEFGRGLPGGGPACDIGTPCVADFDGNNQVDLTDFGVFGAEFGRGLPGGGPSCYEVVTNP